MTILVDDAIWPWRGDRWAHLCSDADLDELHTFAHRLGVRRMAFQGDHYDVHVEQRRRALAAGALAVGSRELVRRLRGAGLRVRAGHEAWRWTPHFEGHLAADGRGADTVVEVVTALLATGSPSDGIGPSAVPSALADLAGLERELGVRIASRPGEIALVLRGEGLASLAAATWGEAVVVHHPASGASGDLPGQVTGGDRSVLEVFIPRPGRADV